MYSPGSWLRSLHADLFTSEGWPLPPPRLAIPRVAAWLPPVMVVLCAAVLAGLGWHVLLTDYDIPNRLAASLGIAQALPLVLGLFRPMLAWWLALAVAATTALVARSGGAAAVWPDPTLLVYLGTLALLGFRLRPRVLAEIWLLTVLSAAVTTLASPGPIGTPDLPEIAILTGAVLIAVGSLRAVVDARQRLAEQTHISEAERDRRALLEERARIARELHDVVAHHMSVIAIQAEAAPYRLPNPPEELSRSFAAIRTNALDALAELRRVLGLLRSDEGEDDTLPQPTLDRLDDLVLNGRHGGLAVTARISGAVRPLPPGVELSAYRIVQEALSNAMRHAPGSDVEVDIDYREDAVGVRVTNGPRRAPTEAPPSSLPRASGGGQGVLGMRERAAMLGAELVAGPEPSGGYSVAVVLPTSGRPDP